MIVFLKTIERSKIFSSYTDDLPSLIFHIRVH